jgi:hypothetical protein
MSPSPINSVRAAQAATSVGPGQSVAGHQASLTDFQDFGRSLDAAQQRLTSSRTTHSGEFVQALFRPLDFINDQAKELSVRATEAAQAGADFSPGEMVSLSVKCHEFMFHCQLTSNIANRSADGLTQLFKQQS